MVKKIFVVFIACSFFSNIAAFDVAAMPVQNKNPARFRDKATDIQIEKTRAMLSRMIEQVKRLGPADGPLVSAAIEKHTGSASLDQVLDQYQVLADSYLDELAQDQDFEVAPGCLPYYTFAFLTLFGITPIITGTAGLYVLYEDDVACIVSYSAWGLSAFSLGLLNWLNYRICAEEYTGSPDPDVIRLLEDDKLFVASLGAASLLVSLVTRVNCEEYYWEEYWEDD